MAHFRTEHIVSGVKSGALYAWYTDFRPDDLQILEKQGAQGIFTSREVKRKGTESG
jgi:hypothetical protein